MCTYYALTQAFNSALQRLGFKQSAMDECVWYTDETILFYYVDDVIFMEPDSKAIDKAVKEIKRKG